MVQAEQEKPIDNDVATKEGKSEKKSQGKKSKGKKSKGKKGKKTARSHAVLARLRNEHERIAAGRAQERAHRLQTQMFTDFSIRKQLASTVYNV